MRSTILVVYLVLTAGAVAAGPWWDDYPLIVQTGNVATARDFHGNTVLCGAADES